MSMLISSYKGIVLLWIENTGFDAFRLDASFGACLLDGTKGAICVQGEGCRMTIGRSVRDKKVIGMIWRELGIKNDLSK